MYLMPLLWESGSRLGYPGFKPSISPQNRHIFRFSSWVAFKNVHQQEKKKRRPSLWKVLFAGCIVASLPGSGCLGRTVRVRKRRRRRREDEEEVLNPANPAALNLCLSAPEEERELEHCEPVTATRAPPAASASLHYFFFLFLSPLHCALKKKRSRD